MSSTDAVNYRIIGLVENNVRTFNVSTDLDTYQIGDTVTIAAVLESGGVGLPGPQSLQI